MDGLLKISSLIRFFLISVLTVVVLAGCSGTDSGSSDDAGAAPTTPTNPGSPFSISVSLVDPDGEATTNVSSAKPGTLTAILRNNGVPVSSELMTFSLNGDIGELLPVAGTALTGPNGAASIVLNAGAEEGAGTVTVTAENLGTTGRLSFAVSVSVIAASMEAPTVFPQVLSASGTAVVEVIINQTVNGFTSPITESVEVKFDSGCVQRGEAVIDAVVDTVDGVARATYEDNGCGTEDNISVTAVVGSQLLSRLVSLSVQKADVGSIQFLSATPEILFVTGSGGEELSRVKFVVRDGIGNFSRDTTVNFQLNTIAGDISLLHSQAQTNSLGEVVAFVQSGRVNGVVSVLASIPNSGVAATSSRNLVILRGVPTQQGFSIAVDNFNPEGLNADGEEVTVTASLSDRFTSGVPDGTVVGFRAEFGVIVGAGGSESCSTVNSRCSVTWRSQGSREPLPFRDPGAITRQLGDGITPCLDDLGNTTDLNNDSTPGFVPCIFNAFHPKDAANAESYSGLGQVYGNRVTIMGFVAGEESFTDSNDDGLFNIGESFEDLTEPFLDHNEDQVYGNTLGNGLPATNASTYNDPADADDDSNDDCYDGSGDACFQAGGDNDEFVDGLSGAINEFDVGNGIYNGSLCAIEGEECTTDLALIWRETVILQSGSFAKIGLIEEGLNASVKGNYFQDVDLSGDGKIIVAYVSDIHNGRMPSGTTITLSGNGTIKGPNSCTVNSSNAIGITKCSFAIAKDVSSINQDNSHAVLTVRTPNDVVTTARILVKELR